VAFAEVAVIGAGAAGLVCARELTRAGLSATVFEASDDIGGTWIYDPSAGVHGSMYASLRTNLPTDLMAFRDFPFDARGGGEAQWPRFVGHREVRIYLERFAQTFGVLEQIRFNHRVESVERRGHRWILRTRDRQDRASVGGFDGVAVCNGHYHRPEVPDLPGLEQFAGRVVHSHDYRVPDPYRGRRVAILGAKSSGIDISGELAGVAAEVFLCARDQQGAPQRTGIEVRAPIASIEGQTLELADGSRLEHIDDLLLCTGYCYDFPFFPARPDFVTLEPKWIHPLWLDLIAIRAPNLAFIGLPFQVVPFPQMEIQARVFAHLLSGRIVLPRPAMLLQEHARKVAALQAAGVARRHYFRHGAQQFAYYDALARRVGSPPLPPWFQPLYEATSAAKRADPDGYRDAVLPAGDRVPATSA
jgi:cation diffusion facilitator CzcD-associated flavoprotein CzcO